MQPRHEPRQVCPDCKGERLKAGANWLRDGHFRSLALNHERVTIMRWLGGCIDGGDHKNQYPSCKKRKE